MLAESTALTPREQEVFSLLMQGKTSAEIAAALCIEECTVRRHLINIRDRLNATTNEHAVYIHLHIVFGQSSMSC